MISDGRYVDNSRRFGNEMAKKLEQKDSRPLYVYEPAPLTVRMPDGKMMLMNQ